MSLLIGMRPQSAFSGILTSTHEDLPEYTLQPICSSIVPDTWRQEPIVVRIQDATCTFGTFIKGSIQITPHRTFMPLGINLEILSRERSGSYGEAAPVVLKRVIAVSHIPIDTPFYAGYCYKLPFAIKFPEEDWIGSCKCGKGHDTLPPSLGIHKLNVPIKCDCSYNLKISIVGYLFNAYKALQFTPISVYQPGEKEVSTCYTLRKTLRNGYKSPGRIIAHRSYLHHSGDPNESLSVHFKLYYLPHHCHTPPLISQLEYKVVRCVFWSKSAIESLEIPQKEQLLKRERLGVICEWIENKHADVHFDLNLTGCEIPLEPTYTGCLTAIRYKVLVTINGITISQPLTIGGLALRPESC